MPLQRIAPLPPCRRVTAANGQTCMLDRWPGVPAPVRAASRGGAACISSFFPGQQPFALVSSVSFDVGYAYRTRVTGGGLAPDLANTVLYAVAGVGRDSERCILGVWQGYGRDSGASEAGFFPDSSDTKAV